MELRLLQLNKWFSNFSTKLVTSFVCILVYKYTGLLYLAFLTLMLQNVLNLFFNFLLRNVLVKYPQFFLMFRIVPIIFYEVCVLLINIYSSTTSNLLLISGIAVGVAFSYTCKFIPSEALYSYNSIGKGAEKLGQTKLIEHSAMVAGILFGGFIIDTLPLYIVVIISIVLYLVGSIPFYISYYKNKKNKKYNVEYIAYAHLVLKELDGNTKSHKIGLKFRHLYGLNYSFLSCMKAFYYLLPLLVYVFSSGIEVSNTAYIIATYEGVLGLSSFVVGKLDGKYDLTRLNTIACFIGAGLLVAIPFVITSLWIYLILSMLAICYTFPSIFIYNRMITKSRYLGKNNLCVMDKLNLQLTNNSIIDGFGIFMPFPWLMFICAACLFTSGIISPIAEEKTRILLVDHFNKNEIESDFQL